MKPMLVALTAVVAILGSAWFGHDALSAQGGTALKGTVTSPDGRRMEGVLVDPTSPSRTVLLFTNKRTARLARVEFLD